MIFLSNHTRTLLYKRHTQHDLTQMRRECQPQYMQVIQPTRGHATLCTAIATRGRCTR